MFGAVSKIVPDSLYQRPALRRRRFHIRIHNPHHLPYRTLFNEFRAARRLGSRGQKWKVVFFSGMAE